MTTKVLTRIKMPPKIVYYTLVVNKKVVKFLVPKNMVVKYEFLENLPNFLSQIK